MSLSPAQHVRGEQDIMAAERDVMVPGKRLFPWGGGGVALARRRLEGVHEIIQAGW